MRNRLSFSVLIKNAKNTKKKGEKVILGNFLDPGSPRLASSSPGRANLLQSEAPTHLGELQVHQVSFFAINRCEGG